MYTDRGYRKKIEAVGVELREWCVLLRKW